MSLQGLSLDVIDDTINEWFQYHDILWENAKQNIDVELGRHLLQKMGFTNYVDYIYRQMAFQEVFDLPDIMLDKIIDKIPVEGISRYLRLSEVRINKYAEYLNGELLATNKSFTKNFFNIFKEKIDTGAYLEIAMLDKKVVDHYLRILNRGNSKDGSSKYLPILKNPMLPSLLLSIFDDTRDIDDNREETMLVMFAMNPVLNESFETYIGGTSEQYFRTICMRNPVIPLDYARKILVKHPEQIHTFWAVIFRHQNS